MDPTPIETIITALTTGFGTMATDALGGIAAVVPVVLPILTAIIVIGIVVRVVKRIAGR